MHPDRGGKAEDFKKLQRAHEILSDVAKRRDYDFTLKYGRPYVDPPVDPRDAKAEHPYARYRDPRQQQAASLPPLQLALWCGSALALGLAFNAISSVDAPNTDTSGKMSLSSGKSKPILKIRSEGEVVEKTRAFWNPVSCQWERLSESQGAPLILDFINFYNIPYSQRHGLPRYLREEYRPLDETVEASVVQDLNTQRAVRVNSIKSELVRPDAINF